jgi:hypothetical protein
MMGTLRLMTFLLQLLDIVHDADTISLDDSLLESAQQNVRWNAYQIIRNGLLSAGRKPSQ